MRLTWQEFGATLVAPTRSPESLITFVDQKIYGTNPSLTLDAAFSISEADMKHVNTIGGSAKAVNYGEVTLESWSKVLDVLQPTRDDVFVDLGSGRGLLAMYTCLRCKCRSVGVELSRERHAMACTALVALRSTEFASDAARLAFVNEDIRTCSCLDHATIVFLMNQDMPHKLIADCWRRFLSLGRPLTVVTLHPPKDVNLFGLQPEHTLTLPQTWNAAIPIHVYRLPANLGQSASGGGASCSSAPRVIVCVSNKKRSREGEC